LTGSPTFCSSCGHANPVGFRFCRSCGGAASLAAPSEPAAFVPPPFQQVDRPTAPPPKAEPIAAGPIGSAPSRRWPKGLLVLGILACVGVAVLGGATAWHFIRSGPRAAVAKANSARQDAESELTNTRILGAEKDSLMTDVLESTALLADINEAVSAVQGGRSAPTLEESVGHPLSIRQARALLLPKIDSLRARLDSAQARMTASLDRVHQMTGIEAQLRQQVAQYEETVTSVRKLLASQQEQLNTLGVEVVSLRAENQRLRDTAGILIAAQGALHDTISDLQEAANTVYWIAGSKKALLSAGVVVEEGSGKFIVFGKGKTLAPSRDLNTKTGEFTPVNRRQSQTIVLPKPNIRYRILSRQNLGALQNALDKDGHVHGTLQIADPNAFWAPSRYLILIED
jgi:hypothetical protein